MIMIRMTNIYTVHYMKIFNGMRMDLMCSKDIYPYEWVDSFGPHGLRLHTTNRGLSFITEARSGEQRRSITFFQSL